jgi:hypothetical protein
LVYILPLLALVWSALLLQTHYRSQFLGAALALTYLAFFVLRVAPSYVNAMGLYYTGLTNIEPLRLPRAGGIEMTASQASEYLQAIQLIQEHRRGDYTYSAPDAPEIYFLAGLKSPSRALFDFFEDPIGRNQRTLQALDSHDVNVITIHTPEQTGLARLGTPSFSSVLDPAFVAELRRRYPNCGNTGHFEVRWKQ